MTNINMIVKRITHPLNTKKEEKALCQCDVNSDSPYVQSERKAKYDDKKKNGDHVSIERKFQCTRVAVVTIDDVPMCRNHAGFKVLAAALGESL